MKVSLSFFTLCIVCILLIRVINAMYIDSCSGKRLQVVCLLWVEEVKKKKASVSLLEINRDLSHNSYRLSLQAMEQDKLRQGLN